MGGKAIQNKEKKVLRAVLAERGVKHGPHPGFEKLVFPAEEVLGPFSAFEGPSGLLQGEEWVSEVELLFHV